MESRQWLNRSQPQTLQIAVMLLYLNAFFQLIRGLGGGSIFLSVGLVVLVGEVAGAFGIANERKWGYYVGLAASGLVAALAVAVAWVVGFAFASLLNMMFDVAVVALLLHPMSRSYKSIWFK